MVTNRLVDAGLVYEGATAFVTPRRLALAVQGIPARQPDLKEEKQGAAGRRSRHLRSQGFLQKRRARLACRGDDPEGPQEGRLLCRADREAGPRRASTCWRKSCRSIIRTFPWPKSMRWGERSARPGALHLGAAAAFDRRDLRAGDRTARHRAVCDRRHRGGR